MQTPDDGNVVFDDFAWKLAEKFLEDLQPFLRTPFHDAAKEALASRNVDVWRRMTCAMFDEYQSPHTLKAERQITELFKKFSFSSDVYTPDQLQEDSKRKFLANQERLISFVIDESDPVTRDILFRARGWCDLILQDVSPLEICEKATFGKKSSVGVPMREACEGARYESPISGSADHIDWFQKYFGVWNSPALQYARERAALSQEPPFYVVDCLEAVLVPKTWKSLRMIMPNTTLGTLYSGGLGRVLEDRLRKAGYDIKHLQEVHGQLARIGSVTGSLVTADQSLASDNITASLVDRIFPWRWASALRFGRIQRIALKGDIIESPTFSTMGIGFTFPLQTLLFLVLLLAIRDHLSLDEATVVSVFGDDLIYAKEMHDLVVTTFPKLGLVLNLDKTFSEGLFRESCGQDYFRGYDVRPAFLAEAAGQSAGKRRAEAYLYKTLNTILRRWSPLEVNSVIHFISEEIRRVRKDDPLVVPNDYPDTSGVKYDPLLMQDLGLARRWKKDEHGTYRFKYLAFEPDTRPEPRHAPYLFRRLASSSQPLNLYGPRIRGIRIPLRGVGDVLSEMTPILDWMKHPDGVTYRSKRTGKRHHLLLATIPQQDSGRFRERTGISSHWTP